MTEEQLKARISREISDYVAAYRRQGGIHTAWGKPLVGYAGVRHPYIRSLRRLVDAEHGLPQEILEDATVVLVYYVPFTKELAQQNRTGTNLAAPQWARAYEETNAMFAALNRHLTGFLKELGCTGVVPPQAAVFDRKRLISQWSFRHFAYAAGLGTFGINNMLITAAGCCGRFNTLVTNLDVTPGRPLKDEYCLFKKRGICGACLRHCPTGALQEDGFDRQKCYGNLLQNASVYKDFGSSYGAGDLGSEVCGKCVTQSPCAFTVPGRWR